MGKISGQPTVLDAHPYMQLSLLSMGILCNVELFFLIPMTFKRRSGLYFGSCIAAAIGTSLMSLQLLLVWFVLGERLLWLSCSLAVLGYMMYLLGDYMMLYSRLHLLGTSPKVICWTLRVITIESICFEIPCIILYSIAYWGPSPALSSAISNFTIAESVLYWVCQTSIALLYLFQMRKTWQTGTSMSTAQKRTLKKAFLGMLVLILMLVISPLLGFIDQLDIQLAFSVRLSVHLDGKAPLTFWK
jgi:hypothetical protein